MADEGLQKELDQLKSDIAKLRADLTTIGDGVKKLGTEAVGATQAKVKSVAQDALDEFQTQLNEAKLQGQQVAQNLEQEVKDKPLTSLALAFGVGYLLSKILDRGR